MWDEDVWCVLVGVTVRYVPKRSSVKRVDMCRRARRGGYNQSARKTSVDV